MSRSDYGNITAMILLFTIGIIAKVCWDDGTPLATVVGVLGGYLRAEAERKET